MLKKHILVFLGLFACVILSCTQQIEGELTILVDWDDEGVTASSPEWSSDGSKVFFISTWDSTGNYDTSRVWCVNVNTGETTLVSPEEYPVDYRKIDVDLIEDRCVTYWPSLYGLFRVYDTETWSQLDSVLPPEDFETKSITTIYYPKFSYESNQVFYYMYHVLGDASYLRKVNLVDSTDEIILTVKQSWFFAPGPGDTLFAVGDTIYNLNTDERISMGLEELLSTGSMDWNPANPDELIIAKGIRRDIYIYSIEHRELTRLDTDFGSGAIVEGARFSPDGDRIVFSVDVPVGGTFIDKIWIFEPEE